MNSQRLRQHSQGLHGSAPDESRAERRRGHRPTSQPRSCLQLITIFYGNLVFSKGVSLGKQTILKGRLLPSRRCQQKTTSVMSPEVPCLIMLSWSFSLILFFMCILSLFFYPTDALCICYGFQFSGFSGVPECANRGYHISICFLCLFLESFPFACLSLSDVSFCLVLL